MTDDYDAEYIGDDTPPESHEEATAQVEEPQGTDYEAEARKQGWKPKDEFDGPAERWRPADEFVNRGNQDPKILYSRVQKLDKTLSEERRAREEERRQVEDRFERLTRMQEMALLRQRQSIQTQFANVKRQAAAEGDTELYDHVEKQERETRQQWADEDRQQEQAKPQAQTKQFDVQPEVRSWIERNPWFDRDRTLTEEATAYETYLAQSRPGLSLEERLEETRKHVVNQFPHKFGRKQKMNGQQRSGSPVDGGQRQAGAASDDNGFSQLPGEARQQFKAFAKEGLFEDTAAGRAQYARYYNDPNADKRAV